MQQAIKVGINEGDKIDDQGRLVGLVRTAFDTVDSNFDELFSRTQGVVSVTGGTADDTDAFSAAITAAAAGNLTVLADADEYNLDPTALGVISDSVSIRFGPNTVINNLQSSGTKLPTLRFAGAGLTGSAITVSSLEAGGLKNEITVSDASGFAVGDVVLLSENEAVQTPTQFDASAEDQDFNYREYLTIGAISGNDIEFEEFIRFPHDTANTLRLQKVSFLDDVHVSGGVFKGPNASGGGVGMTFCRNSSVQNVRCLGLAENDKNGGAALELEDNWLCRFDGISAKHTQYITETRRNQSCQYSRISGKRTEAGGVIVNGERFGQYSNIQQDASGDTNGDSFQIGNGSRCNVFSNIVLHGASCYTMWMHESCDNNKIIGLKSVAGITTGLNIYGNDNQFVGCDIIGHGGGGVKDGGQRNSYTSLHVDGVGNGVFLKGSGTYVEGIARTDPAGSLRDIQFNNATNCVVKTRNGTVRGVNYSGTNTGNSVQHEGDAPTYDRKTIAGRGWTWSKFMLNVMTSTAANVPLINEDNTESDWVSRNSADAAVMYRVCLSTSSAGVDRISEYIIVDRQNNLYLRPLYVGSDGSAPRLQINSGNVQIVSTSAGPASVVMMVQRF